LLTGRPVSGVHRPEFFPSARAEKPSKTANPPFYRWEKFGFARISARLQVNSSPAVAKFTGLAGEPTRSESASSRSRAHSATRGGRSAHHNQQPAAQTEKQRVLSAAMDRAHRQNFSDAFPTLTPPRAGARNPFDVPTTDMKGRQAPPCDRRCRRPTHRTRRPRRPLTTAFRNALAVDGSRSRGLGWNIPKIKAVIAMARDIATAVDSAGLLPQAEEALAQVEE
jgi:hypothetical protein